MGLQAEVQEELVKLLRCWIPDKKEKKQKIVLRVDDIDRCQEETVLPAIDALRVMLEDEEISKRLIIITAIDERILRSAIALKYRHLDATFGSRKGKDVGSLPSAAGDRIIDYMDKLFIFAIKLGNLSIEHKDEFLDQLLGAASSKHADSDATTASAEQADFIMQSESQLYIVEVKRYQPEGRFAAQSGEQAAKPPNEPEWVALDKEEDVLIRQSIHQWPEVTPRKMVIFYYRYLPCKNILIARYAASGRTNAWLDSGSVKALLSLLRYFGQSHQSDSIGQELERLRSKGGVPKWGELKALPGKDKFDYQMLLATLELVVAY